MYKFKQIFKLDLINLFTNPMWIFYAICFPIILILILGFLASGRYGDVLSSYDYYGVSLIVYGVFNAATFSANIIMEDRIKSPNMRVIYSPVHPFSIHFSKVLASFVFSTVCYTFVGVALYFIAGINFGGAAATWAIFAIMLLSIFLFSSLGILVCCLLRDENITNQILTLLFAVFAVLGGIFFPVSGLGKAISLISWASPAKWILTAYLRIIYDKNYSMFLPVCGMLIVLSAISVFLSSKLFKGEDYI